MAASIAQGQIVENGKVHRSDVASQRLIFEFGFVRVPHIQLDLGMEYWQATF